MNDFIKVCTETNQNTFVIIKERFPKGIDCTIDLIDMLHKLNEAYDKLPDNVRNDSVLMKHWCKYDVIDMYSAGKLNMMCANVINDFDKKLSEVTGLEVKNKIKIYFSSIN